MQVVRSTDSSRSSKGSRSRRSTRSKSSMSRCRSYDEWTTQFKHGKVCRRLSPSISEYAGRFAAKNSRSAGSLQHEFSALQDSRFKMAVAFQVFQPQFGFYMRQELLRAELRNSLRPLVSPPWPSLSPPPRSRPKSRSLDFSAFSACSRSAASHSDDSLASSSVQATSTAAKKAIGCYGCDSLRHDFSSNLRLQDSAVPLMSF